MNRGKMFFRDLNNIIWMNLKVIIKNREALIVLLMGTLIFIIVSSTLVLGAEDRSSVPIGIIDQDKSTTSSQLMERIKKMDAFYVYTGTENSLDKKLNDQNIMAYFVIKKGFQQRIQIGETTDLIEIFYLKENQNVSILTDIFASEMIYDISLAKCIQLYEKYEDQYILKSKEEYTQYIESIQNNPSYHFAFDMEFVNVNTENKGKMEDSIRNGLLYVQIVIDLLATLLSFFIMFLVYGIKNEGILKNRIEITVMNKIALEIGKTVSVMALISVLSAGCGIYFARIIGISNLPQTLHIILLIQLFSFIIVEIFLLISSILESGILYQFVGSILILLFGGIAGISLLGNLVAGNFISDDLLNIFKIAPNYWFIKGFTDIIVNGNLVAKTTDRNIYLFLFACGLCTLRIVINRIRCQRSH